MYGLGGERRLIEWKVPWLPEFDGARPARVGITDNERGEVRLTALGRRIANSAQETVARVDAFMNVPLYDRIFKNHEGFSLPGAEALEKFMRDIGVSSKQTGRARQAFMRSAKQAGFFAHGEDRLVRPALAGPGTKPIDSSEPEKDVVKKSGGGSGPDDPLIQALIQKLPHTGPWAVDERVTWLKMLAMAFQITYGQEQNIEIKKEAAGDLRRPLRQQPTLRLFRFHCNGRTFSVRPHHNVYIRCFLPFLFPYIVNSCRPFCLHILGSQPLGFSK